MRVRLQPGAAREELVGLETLADGGQALKVKVTAPPEGGKANAALIKLLAKQWKLPKSAFEITAGHRARLKTLFIAGDPKDLRARIAL